MNAQFQYEDITNKSESYLEEESYDMRHIYNLYTSGGKHLCPDGGILTTTQNSADHYTFRVQANYAQVFKEKHHVEAIVGVENRETNTRNLNNRLLGYKDKTQTNTMASSNLNAARNLQTSDLGPMFSNPWMTFNLVSGWETAEVKHRYVSGYFTGNYTYDRRYSLSGSWRIDKTDLFGADPKQSGKISIMDKQTGKLREVTINTPQDAVKYGIGYLSEDRRRYGVVVQKSVNENTTLATMEEFTNGIFINKAKEKKVAEKYVNELATKTPTTDQLVVNLSGGNQQKVVIAKWLTRDSDILIFDEPTRGIDVGAKNEIYKLMNRLAAEGKSIIMISSEMTEVLRMSDRIIIMCEGKVTGCIDISEATQENIMDKATRNID